MSVQFGEANFDGRPIDPKELDKVKPLIAPYGPDGEGFISGDGFGLLFRAFCTAAKSRQNTQPYLSTSGSIFMWDGRLDNRRDVIEMLDGKTSPCSTDLELAAAGYEYLGTDVFRKLIGDWALSMWDPIRRVLILGKDFLGTRTLYYSLHQNQITWCTILEPLVLLSKHLVSLSEEYIAGWLSEYPACHLTPYAGIEAVPPSSFVRFANGRREIVKYWDFDSTHRIHYLDDRDYECHFRTVFSQSVRRRLGSAAPVLAELSGGMDSSSIVCVADQLLAENKAETPRLDTISYFDDSEPNWNERPYFEIVEKKRGITGCHIDVGSQRASWDVDSGGPFSPLPHFSGTTASAQLFLENVVKNGNRVLLCGIGGDEVLGGVPSPIPELADLLATQNLVQFGKQLRAWALATRKPMLLLICETLQPFLPSILSTANGYQPVSWMSEGFATRQRDALNGYRTRMRVRGPLPSYQENIRALEILRRQLALSCLSASPLLGTCYPYLDRDLLEFLFAIPREQLIRPRERRSLMRRSLRGIVPDGILDRKRKAFALRRNRAALRDRWPGVIGLTQDMLMSRLGVVRRHAFVAALEQIHRGREAQISTAVRTLSMEAWLQHIRRYGPIPDVTLASARGGI